MGLGVDGTTGQACLSEDQASNFVRGALTGPEYQAVEFHLDRCAQCLQCVAALAQALSSHEGSSLSESWTTVPDAPTAEPRKTPSIIAAVEGLSFRGTERFRVLRRLGAGAMGVVYEAFDREHGTRIALKLLPDLAPDELLRFKNEFRSLQDLQHPNLVRM